MNLKTPPQAGPGKVKGGWLPFAGHQVLSVYMYMLGLGTSWTILVSSWGHLGTFLGNIGPSWGHLEMSWDRLGLVLGPFVLLFREPGEPREENPEGSTQ